LPLSIAVIIIVASLETAAAQKIQVIAVVTGFAVAIVVSLEMAAAQRSQVTCHNRWLCQRC